MFNSLPLDLPEIEKSLKCETPCAKGIMFRRSNRSHSQQQLTKFLHWHRVPTIRQSTYLASSFAWPSSAADSGSFSVSHRGSYSTASLVPCHLEKLYRQESQRCLLSLLTVAHAIPNVLKTLVTGAQHHWLGTRPQASESQLSKWVGSWRDFLDDFPLLS